MCIYVFRTSHSIHKSLVYETWEQDEEKLLCWRMILYRHRETFVCVSVSFVSVLKSQVILKLKTYWITGCDSLHLISYRTVFSKSSFATFPKKKKKQINKPPHIQLFHMLWPYTAEQMFWCHVWICLNI